LPVGGFARRRMAECRSHPGALDGRSDETVCGDGKIKARVAPQAAGATLTMSSVDQTRDELGYALNGTDFAGVDIAVLVDGDAFPNGAVASHDRGTLGNMLGNEIVDFTGAGTSHTQPLAPARVVVLIGFRVDGIEHVVVIDEHAADTAELIPGIQVVAFLVEDLDAAVATIRNKQTALGVHRQCVRRTHLAVLVAPLTPALDESAIWRVFGDAADGVWPGLIDELGAM